MAESAHTTMRQPPPTMIVYFCEACGWDSAAWGPDFWQCHFEEGEHRKPGLPCLDSIDAKPGKAVRVVYGQPVIQHG